MTGRQMVMLERAVAIIGGPAAGKTTLTMRLGQVPGQRVFRLREHVPEAILAATVTSADRLGWIDDLTVTRALRSFIDSAVRDRCVHAVLLDNFPGTETQAHLLVSMLHKLAPRCVVQVVELLADPVTVERRVRDRRVCHQCECDPIHDPRLPARPSPTDSRRCAHCGSILHPRRGDAPRLLRARIERYEQATGSIRAAFAAVGIGVTQLDCTGPPEHTVNELTVLLTTGSTSL